MITVNSSQNEIQLIYKEHLHLARAAHQSLMCPSLANQWSLVDTASRSENRFSLTPVNMHCARDLPEGHSSSATETWNETSPICWWLPLTDIHPRITHTHGTTWEITLQHCHALCLTPCIDTPRSHTPKEHVDLTKQTAAKQRAAWREGSCAVRLLGLILKPNVSSSNFCADNQHVNRFFSNTGVPRK